MKKHILEDDSADDRFDFATLNIPDPIPFDLTTKVEELVDGDDISTQNILDLHVAVTERKGNFAHVLGQVVEIIELNDSYYSSFEDLLRLYREDPLHLLFMSSDDRTDLVIVHSDNYGIVRFGLKHYKDDIDVEEIRDQLGAEEGDTTELLKFDCMIGWNNEDPVNVLGGNSYDSYELEGHSRDSDE